MDLVNPRDDGSHDDTISLVLIRIVTLSLWSHLYSGHCCYICYGMQWRKVDRDWQRILHPVAATWHWWCVSVFCVGTLGYWWHTTQTGDIETRRWCNQLSDSSPHHISFQPLSLDPIWIQTDKSQRQGWQTNSRVYFQHTRACNC